MTIRKIFYISGEFSDTMFPSLSFLQEHLKEYNDIIVNVSAELNMYTDVTTIYLTLDAVKCNRMKLLYGRVDIYYFDIYNKCVDYWEIS